MEASDVTIKTCSVEVKVVRIDRRQMTLSVFRQVPLRHIIDPGKGLLGEPWGLVNYFWDGCGYHDQSPHLHVLWSAGGRLYRSCVGHLHASDLMYCRNGYWYTSHQYQGGAEGFLLRGDMLALRWLAWLSPTHDLTWVNGDCCLPVPAPIDPEIDRKFEWWEAHHDNLAVLDQLFIAT